MKSVLFSPIINKKDWRANFWIKRFHVPSFSACAGITPDMKWISIWHNLGSMHEGFSGFLKQVGSLIRLLNPYKLQKDSTQGGITNLWMMPEPARANQSYPKLPRAGKRHPEPTRASQRNPRTIQSQLETARVSQ